MKTGLNIQSKNLMATKAQKMVSYVTKFSLAMAVVCSLSFQAQASVDSLVINCSKNHLFSQAETNVRIYQETNDKEINSLNRDWTILVTRTKEVGSESNGYFTQTKKLFEIHQIDLNHHLEKNLIIGNGSKNNTEYSLKINLNNHSCKLKIKSATDSIRFKGQMI